MSDLPPRAALRQKSQQADRERYLVDRDQRQQTQEAQPGAVRAGGRDPDRGTTQAILPNGGTASAALLYDASPPKGSVLKAAHAHPGRWTLDTRSAIKTPTLPTREPRSIKVLFYKTEVDPQDGISKRHYYIGGDRINPLPLGPLPPSLSSNNAVFGFTNTGKGQNDWIASACVQGASGFSSIPTPTRVYDFRTKEVFEAPVREFAVGELENSTSLYYSSGRMYWSGYGFWVQQLNEHRINIVQLGGNSGTYASGCPGSGEYEFRAIGGKERGSWNFAPFATHFWEGEWIQTFGEDKFRYEGNLNQGDRSYRAVDIVHPALPLPRSDQTRRVEVESTILKQDNILLPEQAIAGIAQQISKTASLWIESRSGVTYFQTADTVISLGRSFGFLDGYFGKLQDSIYYRFGALPNKLKTQNAELSFGRYALPDTKATTIKAIALSLNSPNCTILTAQYAH
jgi:hypothetical protein